MGQKKIRRKPDSELALPGTSSPTKLPPPFERGSMKRVDAADKAGEASPHMQKAQSSDRQSDNESNQSSDRKVGYTKKTTKNKEQVKTKPLRKKTLDFNPESNPALVKWFDKVTNQDRRLKNQQQFRTYLSERYQHPIANQMASILSPRF